MFVNWTVFQRELVSKKMCVRNVIGVAATVAVLVATPAISHTVLVSKNAANIKQIPMVLLSVSNRRAGKPIYICSPAGFGKKSRCYVR